MKSKYKMENPNIYLILIIFKYVSIYLKIINNNIFIILKNYNLQLFYKPFKKRKYLG